MNLGQECGRIIEQQKQVQLVAPVRVKRPCAVRVADHDDEIKKMIMAGADRKAIAQKIGVTTPTVWARVKSYAVEYRLRIKYNGCRKGKRYKKHD
tara:strand:- start:5056 stop:5340 length:285 start_codon:yes stop_codon:yes gene_type:complete